MEEELAISQSFILNEKGGKRVYLIGEGLEEGGKSQEEEGKWEEIREEDIVGKDVFEF